MKKLTIFGSFLFLLLIACNESGGSGNSPGGDGNNNIQNNKGEVSEWQYSLLGQEGHGGDAIVCFSIPIERALYKVNTKPENECPQGDPPCSETNSSTSPNNPGSTSSGIVWRMTDEGRRSIQSAKPLEQYLGERILSKKVLIDQLNQMSLEEGYEKVLQPFVKLPAPFNRIAEIHRKLGWLNEDGISSVLFFLK